MTYIIKRQTDLNEPVTVARGFKTQELAQERVNEMVQQFADRGIFPVYLIESDALSQLHELIAAYGRASVTYGMVYTGTNLEDLDQARKERLDALNAVAKKLEELG